MSEGSSTTAKSTKTSVPKLVSLWLALFAVVLTAGIITIAQLNATQFSAETFAKRYLDSLRTGDGGAALGLLSQREVNGQAVLLDGEALRASVERMQRVEFGESRADDGGKIVPLSYTLDGHRHEVQLHVKHEGRAWLFFNQWSLAEPLSTINVATGPNTSKLLVNGQPAPVNESKANLATFFPATVHVSDDSKYLAAQSKTLAVDASGKALPLELQAAPTEDLQKAVQKDINDYLDECAKQKVLQPTGCPLSHATTDRVDPETIKWEIRDYPKVSIEKDGDNWDVPVLDFQARIKYTGIDLMTGESKDYDINMNSEVDADLKLAPNQYFVKPFVTERWLKSNSAY